LVISDELSAGPCEVFPAWERARRMVELHAREAPLPASVPYSDASELCAELRERGTMTLQTIARDTPHPLLSEAPRRDTFCELVGAVTAYVLIGEKPELRADVPAPELLAVA
jgi:hypothetical protein